LDADPEFQIIIDENISDMVASELEEKLA